MREFAAEPLARLDDLAEYRKGLALHLAGEWDEERWTSWRVRYGVYGQRQPGVQMVRIKIPGGLLPADWLKTLARLNRAYAKGEAHLTTRQDLQIYHVPLARTPDLLEELYSAGLTTREACGNTLRNMTACALAGACPRELVDAGKVAAQLARSWIRHPLVQHMPRKFKVTVSGCATDCGGSAIHDLAFVAIERGGRPGFRVLAGGGLGAQAITAVEVLDFVAEAELPAVVEAAVRLHQRYSDRRNRNRARLKFVVRRFGGEKFAALFREEFERLRGLGQRPFSPFAWRRPAEAPVARSPAGRLAAHDGTVGIVAYVPLGLVSSDQMEGLYQIAADAKVAELRTTRDQNLALLGIAPHRAAEVAAGLESIGFQVPDAPEDVPDVVSCPGTTTCRIGITNSQSFARRVEEAAAADPLARGVSVHVSGCQNSCGLHQVADIGLHGMAKKIEGRAAPHYQIHLGGDARMGEIGLAGPVVPARLGLEAVRLLRAGYVAGRRPGETVRGWAARLGKDGLAGLLAPIDGRDADGMFVDWGEAADFAVAPQMRGDCAAPFATDELLADLADDALIGLDRFTLSGRLAEARAEAGRAMVFAARRLLAARGQDLGEETPADAVLATMRAVVFDLAEVVAALDAAQAAQARAVGAEELHLCREAVAAFIDAVRAAIEEPAAPQSGVGDLDAILGAAE